MPTNVEISVCDNHQNVTLQPSNSGVQGPAIRITGGSSGESAITAERLRTPRVIAVGGDALGESSFDGSQNVTIVTAIEKLSNEDMEAILR